MKELKLSDATKDELLDYFFSPICEGREHLQYPTERFLAWLRYKRQTNIINRQEAVAEAQFKAVENSIDLFRQSAKTDNLDEKLELIKRANRALEYGDNLEKQYKKLDKEYEKYNF